MIDWCLDDNCGPIFAFYIGPEIAPDYKRRITARVKPTTFQLYNDINNDNKIWNLVLLVLLILIDINIKLRRNKNVFCHIVRSSMRRDLKQELLSMLLMP